MNAENDEELTKISMARRERQLEMTQDDHIIKTCLNASFNSLELFIGSNKCLDTVLAISIVRASLMMKVVSGFFFISFSVYEFYLIFLS